MRFALLALIALALAAACARLSGASDRRDPFDIDWDARSAAPGDRPVLRFPRGALLDGKSPFAHPVAADAANTLFEPTLSGEVDAIRFTNADGTDLTPSLRPDAGVGPLLRAMLNALRADGREVPEYLSLVADEFDPARRATARFAVTCYWKGEQKLGVVPGVLATRTGSLDGEEVVEVQFDPTRVTHDALAARARTVSCFRKTVPTDEPGALDASNQQQYHLWLHKPWHYVPLTALQATRVNAALVAGESPDRFLSPTQVTIQRQLQRAYDRDHRSLDALESLSVDRTPQGVSRYAKSLSDRINSL